MQEPHASLWRSQRSPRAITSRSIFEMGAKVASGRTVAVYNVAGNNFRLNTTIHFNTQKVFVPRPVSACAAERPTSNAS